jgi:hypothetical protein
VRAGFDHFLVKPFEPSELTLLLSRQMPHRSPSFRA